MEERPIRGEIVSLTGLRGVAATWVFLGHCAMLMQSGIPLLEWPKLAVDLFILLSGFVMAYQLRSGREQPWLQFFKKRFFRLAPAYYVLLVIAIAIGPLLGEMREVFVTHLSANPVGQGRYDDQSLGNLLIHASFLFGLFPNYAQHTAMPDWSVSLEMQFYIAFPVIALMFRRFGWFAVTLALSALSVCVMFVAGGWIASFPEPAFLPIKLNLFLAGSLLALIPADGSAIPLYLARAALVAAIPMDGEFGTNEIFSILGTGLIGSLACSFAGSWRLPPVTLAERILETRLLRWLGEISFSLYLVHLLLIVPIGSALLRFGIDHWHPVLRFAALASTSLPVVLGGAHLLYRYVELPGIRIGRGKAMQGAVQKLAGRWLPRG